MILFFFPQRIERTLTFLQYKSLENTVGEGEIARKRAISPFPTVFPTLLLRAISPFPTMFSKAV